ncbi:hypothetical protein BCR34DRAFT_634548 [Clohesyomyces aquaticus]|uniref:Uncharacterized protein n=1 Tax=Clohesyomyces aquaticus TaxID=1231657 RepID=A0A1Y2A3R6_9PLEO|nr:hypothetical protein BCR34DRAFT_634548 [Clohesyomyces aquaticus]
MITLWSDSDYSGTKRPDDWMQEPIVVIQHKRESIPSYSKTTVKNWNDGQPGIILNHHVPYNRIARHLIARTDTRTFAQVHKDFKALLKVFGNKKMPFFEPTQSRYDFNEWYTYAWETICDWPNNLFMGPSFGDEGGRVIDVPKNPSAKLEQRLYEARLEYHHALGVHVDLGQNGPDGGDLINDWTPSHDY